MPLSKNIIKNLKKYLIMSKIPYQKKPHQESKKVPYQRTLKRM